MTWTTDNQKNLMLFSGRAHPELAETVADELGIKVTPQTARDFANGELFVRFEESVRGSDAFVLQSCPFPLNQWVMEALIMIDALKRGSAKRISVILPFYPYARQDKKHRGREPISARLIADLLKTAGADRIITVDLHTDQIQGFFDGPVDHMHALGQLSDYVRGKYGTDNISIVSPDSGRVRVAEKWADALGGAPVAFIHKTRDPMVANQVVAHRVVGKVEGRTCVLIDDMIDTGGSASSRTPAPVMSSSPPPTPSSPIRHPSGSPTAAQPRSSRPTLSRFPRRSASTTSPCCRSRRCSDRPSARSSRTVR